MEAIKLPSCKMQKEVQLFAFTKVWFVGFSFEKTKFERPKGIQQHGQRQADAENPLLKVLNNEARGDESRTERNSRRAGAEQRRLL